VGDIISERWAELSRNGWAASFRNHGRLAPESARTLAFFLGLTETADYLKRLDTDFESTITCKELQYGLHHLMQLMKSELQKRKVFAIDQDKSKFYREEHHGVKKPNQANVLAGPATPLFSERAENAFPSACMDIVEAGRCLALGRNNAAIYHLMQVAEIGLRTLAHDRRVAIQRGRSQTDIPLEYAQWGEIIGELEKKKALINNWPRSKSVREEAVRYYASVIFEVGSFNDIYRKHISHARGELYEFDAALNCWGHVSRFMDKLAERMSEGKKTPLVWKVKK
jgi:hypothetical protein